MNNTFALRTLFALLILLAMGFNASAQKVWTLKECIEYALQNNISIKQNEITAKLAHNNYIQNAASMLPTLDGTISHSYNYGRSVDPFSYTFTNEKIQSDNFSLNSGVTLFNGFQLQNTLRQSKLDYMAGRYDLLKISNDVSLNVVSAYLQIVYATDLLAFSDIRVEEFTKQVGRTKLMTDAGSMTRSTLLDAEAQLATEEYNRVTAENNLNSAYLNLAQLMELDSVASVKVSIPDTEISDASILAQSPQMIFTAAQHLPEIKSADTKVLSAEKGLSVARGARSPRLTLFGSLNTGYSSTTQGYIGNPVFNGLSPNGYFTSGGDTVLAPSFIYASEKTSFNKQLDQNYGKSVGLSLNIPLFNGWSTATNVKRAKLNLQNSRYTADLTRNQLYKSIQQAYADALASQKKFAASQKSKDAFTESFAYAEKKFNAGLLSSLEFLTARNNLSKSETDLLQAKYEFIFRVKVLDFYSGKPLTL